MRIFSAFSNSLSLSPFLPFFLSRSTFLGTLYCLINIKRTVAGAGVRNPLVLFILMSRYSCRMQMRSMQQFSHFPSCNLCHFCFGHYKQSDPNTCPTTYLPQLFRVFHCFGIRIYCQMGRMEGGEGRGEGKTTRNKRTKRNAAK